VIATYSTSTDRPHPWAAKRAREILVDALSNPGTHDPAVIATRILVSFDEADLVIVPRRA